MARWLTANGGRPAREVPRTSGRERACALVQGRQDRITPPAGAEDWTALLPNAELLWVPEAGHVPLQERPEVVWPAVERFLAPGR